MHIVTMVDDLEISHYNNLMGIFFSSMIRGDGCLLMHSEIIEDFFWNYAGQINITDNNIDAYMQNIINFYISKNRRPAIYITPSTRPTALPIYLINKNYKLEFTDIWMVYNDKRPNSKLNNNIIIKKVISKIDMDIFIKIFFLAYGGASEDEPYGALSKSYGDALRNSFTKIKDKKINHYLAYLNEEPIGIGSMISSKGFGGIYNVGVIPELRRKGIGSTISMHAVSDSQREGNRITYLMTESESYVEGLYKKLGFKEAFIGMGYVWRDAIDEK